MTAKDAVNGSEFTAKFTTAVTCICQIQVQRATASARASGINGILRLPRGDKVRFSPIYSMLQCASIQSKCEVMPTSTKKKAALFLQADT